MTERSAGAPTPGSSSVTAADAGQAGTAVDDAPALLQMREIAKSFGGVAALRSADFTLESGEVHALLGQNGAGKSTLMNILAGVLRPDHGVIRIDGQQQQFDSPSAAARAGVAMIHQELDLVASTDVTDNLFLGDEVRSLPGIADRRAMARQARDLLEEYSIDIDPRREVGRLRVGEQQMVAIAKALRQQARIIVMDEPTSALSSSEVQTLFDLIPGLTSRGVGIVYISHRMDEIEQICRHATVLRDGRTQGSVDVARTSSDEVIRLMTGSDLEQVFPDRAPVPADAPVRLQVRGLTVAPGRELSRREPRGVDLEVRRGEILGLAGLLGAGRTELLEALYGLGGRRTTGDIRIDGEAVQLCSARAALRHGIGLVPEDRRAAGLVMSEPISTNLVLSVLGQLATAGIRSVPRERSAVNRAIDALRIKAANPSVAVSTLSGGNQQKVVFGRNLLREPVVLLLDDPTRGVDIGAKSEIYTLLDSLAADGLSVLLASSEIPELIGLCDRIAVLRGGEVVQVLEREDATEDRILALASRTPRTSPAPDPDQEDR